MKRLGVNIKEKVIGMDQNGVKNGVKKTVSGIPSGMVQKGLEASIASSRKMEKPEESGPRRCNMKIIFTARSMLVEDRITKRMNLRMCCS